MVGQDNYIFEIFLIGIVAVSSLVQSELVPLVIGVGVVSAAA